MALIEYQADKETYNAFASLSEIAVTKDKVFYDFTAFEGATDAKKEKYLIYASSKFCDMYKFKGYKKKSSQNLCFPRLGTGELNLEDIPQGVKCATVILAYQFFTNFEKEAPKAETIPSLPNLDAKVKREKIGKTLEIEYHTNKDVGAGAMRAKSDKRAYDPIRECLAGLLEEDLYLWRG